ncbi:MAG: DUF3090 family protein [Anaerolineae bacterium]|nr:DUF3090 family protein [Anaerolineae bacterium]
MPYTEIELNPVDFITVGTVGPKGRRTFHVQAGRQSQVVTVTLEKEQTRALGEAIAELLDDLHQRFPDKGSDAVDLADFDMDLRDPVDPLFRVQQIGLGYDEAQDRVVIVVQELPTALKTKSQLRPPNPVLFASGAPVANSAR